MRWFEQNNNQGCDKQGNSDQDNVVTMARSSALNQVEAYWEALRAGRDMPLRSEIDPRGILEALPNAFVLERVAPKVARIRVAGSHIDTLLGMEPRGMPMSCLFAPGSRDGFADVMEDVLNRPAMAQISLGAETGFGKPQLDGQMLLLPLRSDMGDASRILGCFITHGRTGRYPRRFALQGSLVRRVRSKAIGDAAPVSGNVSAPDISAPQMPNLSEPSPARVIQQRTKPDPVMKTVQMKPTKAPHLKLVVTDA